ncbi:autophagy-related protein 13 homolog isoform X2 [Diabrotica virgifera virgifera]|uniref:Autophagy-related protein 13 n=1 Tax=Diabrotica virgifera virgifera TaxID=50390 RepID=A0ABM5JW07_DIAVI|nr:autophagy-related protein 13 homolog isoform X2 [Diabrotica virgifera virgifera]
MKLSTQEKRELDKFTKFLALKCTQIIVQSRLGEKVTSNCRSQTTSTDWFNLNISDLPEVLAETKRVLNGEILSSNLPLCVEISLRTVEGDHMVLENWCLGMLPEQQCDPTTRIVHTIYNRMGTLLKSLVSITRVVPAYKLSRRQGPDSFVICYRIFLGEPLIQCLGEDFNKVQIGQICTPIGTLNLSVSYRTKMTISPTQTGRQNSIMLKSDHFNTKMSPKSRRNNQKEDKTISLEIPMRRGAFANQYKKLETVYLIPKLPYSRINPPPPPKKPVEKKEEESETDGSASTSSADSKKMDNESTEEKNGNKMTDNLANKLEKLTMESTNDDENNFVMVDLKTPFASRTAKTTELGEFFRYCQRAPKDLEVFAEIPPLDESIINRQLETFESDATEYDAMVQSICQSSTNN